MKAKVSCICGDHLIQNSTVNYDVIHIFTIANDNVLYIQCVNDIKKLYRTAYDAKHVHDNRRGFQNL